MGLFPSKDGKYEIINILKKSESKKIIITHGTDKLVEFAKYIKSSFQQAEINQNKRIVLTGSMVPLSNGDSSDGKENLEFSIKSLQKLKAGVYLLFHNKIFDPDNVVKNFKEKTFQEINENKNYIS
jgi:L-asparaginase/Glu-tRNA(Gln) amidotransferase subunit D